MYYIKYMLLCSSPSLAGSAERRDCSRIVLSILLGSDYEYHQTDTHLLIYNYWCMLRDYLEGKPYTGERYMCQKICFTTDVALLKGRGQFAVVGCFLYTQWRWGVCSSLYYFVGIEAGYNSVVSFISWWRTVRGKTNEISLIPRAFEVHFASARDSYFYPIHVHFRLAYALAIYSLTASLLLFLPSILYLFSLYICMTLFIWDAVGRTES